MMITAKLAVIVSLFISNVQLQELDLSQSLKDCLASGNSINVCSKDVIEQFRPVMNTGIPSIGLEPLDPLTVDAISFKFFDATVEFNNVVLKGFQRMIINYSKVDPVKRPMEYMLFMVLFHQIWTLKDHLEMEDCPEKM